MRPLSVYGKYAYYLKHFGTRARFGNVLLNRFELKTGKIRLQSRPYKVTIDPGNFCNLRCPGCHTGIKHSEMIEPSFMGFEAYKTIFGQLKKHAYSVALYNWGEPFLNKQIFSMIRHTTDNATGTTVHSNFNVFSEQMAEDCVKSGLTHIYLSIDGAGQDAYAAYRVRGNLDNVLQNVNTMLETRKRLGSKYPLLTWKFLQFDHNRHELDQARTKAMHMGVDAFETFEAVPKLMDIYDEAELYRKNPSGFKISGKVCSSLWSGIYVHADGSVLPCSLAFRKSESFGNLLHESIDDIWNNASYMAARKMFSVKMSDTDVPLPCRSCKYFLSRQCDPVRGN